MKAKEHEMEMMARERELALKQRELELEMKMLGMDVGATAEPVGKAPRLPFYCRHSCLCVRSSSQFYPLPFPQEPAEAAVPKRDFILLAHSLDQALLPEQR